MSELTVVSDRSKDKNNAVWVNDMEVSTSPPPGYDPGQYRTFYYRIQSLGREENSGVMGSRGVREAEQVIGVVYKIR